MHQRDRVRFHFGQKDYESLAQRRQSDGCGWKALPRHKKHNGEKNAWKTAPMGPHTEDRRSNEEDPWKDVPTQRLERPEEDPATEAKRGRDFKTWISVNAVEVKDEERVPSEMGNKLASGFQPAETFPGPGLEHLWAYSMLDFPFQSPKPMWKADGKWFTISTQGVALILHK